MPPTITTIKELLADTALASLNTTEARSAILHLAGGRPMGEAIDLAVRFHRLTPEHQTATLARQRAGLTLSDAMIATLANL